MSEKASPNITLPEKIYRYYSKNNATDLVKRTIPFLTKQIVRKNKITADEMHKKSNKHRFWRDSREDKIEISEPDNQQLRQKFKSYPREFSPKPGRVHEFKDCHLVGRNAVGLYKGKKLISETSGHRIENRFVGSQVGIIKHSINSYIGNGPEKLEQTIFPLICRSPSYYHWMLQYLPKLRLLELYQDKTGNEPTIIIESNPRNFVYETLRYAGYDTSRYKEWHQQSVAVDNLIVCTHRPHVFNYQKPPLSNYNPSIKDFNWVRDRLRMNTPQSDKDGNSQRRVYISRQDVQRGRKVINYSQTKSVLEKYGFETYKMENMEFGKQLELFYETEIILGPHGAGLLNMIFADDPTVIELFPETMIRPHFQFLSDIMGFDYTPMITKARQNNLMAEGDDNLVVDIDELDSLLHEIVY